MNAGERNPTVGAVGAGEDSGAETFLPLRPVELYVLLALAEDDRHGYAIMQATEERTGGEVRLDPGTLYRALRRMHGQGLVTPSERRPAPELDDQRRRYYAITPLGRRVAAAEAKRMARLVKEACLAEVVDELELA